MYPELLQRLEAACPLRCVHKENTAAVSASAGRKEYLVLYLVPLESKINK